MTLTKQYVVRGYQYDMKCGCFVLTTTFAQNGAFEQALLFDRYFGVDNTKRYLHERGMFMLKTVK